MADNTYPGLDQAPATYAAARADLWADKVNGSARVGASNTRTRATAEWADDLDNAHRATQARLSGAFVNVREYGALGDGTTDDTAAIQAAIDAMESDGGTVLVPRGVHIYTAIALRTGVSLHGAPGSVLKIRDNVSDQNDNIAYYFVRANAVDDIEIRGITFDGNQAENIPAVPGGSWVADILTITGDNIRVVDCTFVDPPDSAIMFAQCTNSRVSRCRIDNAPDLGIYYNDTSGGDAYNNVIDGNVITRCQYGAIGIKRNASDILVTGNAIRDCGNGITVEDFGSGNHPLRVQIVGNRLAMIGHSYEDAAQVGISVQAAHGSIVADNVVDDVIGVGIGLDGTDDCVVAGNYVRGAATGDATLNIGIYLAPRNSQGCQRCIVANNVVRNMQAEGFRAGTGTGDHTHNRVTDNTFESAASDGLRVDSTWRANVVTDNVLDGESATHYDINLNITAGGSNDTFNRWRGNRLVNSRRNGFLDAQTASIVADDGLRRIAVGTAAPTIGTWVVGDVVYNLAPGTDAVDFWLCTVAGTPGTWLAKKGIPGSGAVTLAGNLQLATSGLLIDFDASVSGGNMGCRWNKADANNLTWSSWRNGGVDQWIAQIDTSENWNVLDSASAVALQLQRTGGYVRATNGFRIGGTSGALITSGSGAPAAANPDGSLYLRTDGTAGTTIYVRAAGAWSAIA
jgi:parallel beta-helix repeat protein